MSVNSGTLHGYESYPNRWSDVTANRPALNSLLGFASVLDSNTRIIYMILLFVIQQTLCIF